MIDQSINNWLIDKSPIIDLHQYINQLSKLHLLDKLKKSNADQPTNQLTSAFIEVWWSKKLYLHSFIHCKIYFCLGWQLYFKQPNYRDKLTDIYIYIVPKEIKILLYKLCKSHWGVKTFYSPQCEFTLGCENFFSPNVSFLWGVEK